MPRLIKHIYPPLAPPARPPTPASPPAAPAALGWPGESRLAYPAVAPCNRGTARAWEGKGFCGCQAMRVTVCLATERVVAAGRQRQLAQGSARRATACRQARNRRAAFEQWGSAPRL